MADGTDTGQGDGAEARRAATLGRLENGLRQGGDWYHWGPYLSERQWGTVREDYSANGAAWEYLPHDHARSRAYRWGEDGLAGFSDVEQLLCLGLALWNGRDPILKERIYGLTGNQGNHGEDAKEYWWYLDATPSHSWNRWRYHYPQAPFPYEQLAEENAARGRLDPEYELLDTGIFDDDRYWIVEADYAKADPHELLLTLRVTNAGPEADTLHVLPTIWYRNTWSWDEGSERPELVARDGVVATEHPFLGPLELHAEAAPDGSMPQLLFCDNETNGERIFGTAEAAYPKDGINDHVVGGADTVNPALRGTKAAYWYRVEVAPGATVELRLRLRPAGREPGPDFDEVVSARRREADEFYAELTPPRASADEAMVMRQAFAGMLWSKQLYFYDVERWLEGDPTQPRPPDSRLQGRNARWRNFDAFDIMSMPDCWEYPWFAAWDMAFHCVALAHVDPAFAKYQLTLLCREWFQHPNGAIPAYEWAFDDVNPPVQAWAALEVFAIDGGRDVDFLSRIFDKLLVNFTWWVNRQDEDGSNVFEGGFLGLDNIGPIDRSHLPPGYSLEQSDATGLDGVVRARHGGDRVDPRPPRPARHRPRAQVPGALRADLGRVPRAGPLERRGRLLLRPAPAARRHGGAGAGALDGGDPASDRLRGDRRAGAAARGGRGQAVLAAGRAAAGRPRPARRRGPPRRRARRAAAPARGRRGRAPAADPGEAVRRGRLPLARTACARSLAGTSSTRTTSTSRGWTRRSTTSPPSRRRPCSAATRTGAGPSGSRSTTSSSTRSSATRATSATTSCSSTRPGRARSGRSPRSQRTSGAG